MNPGYSAAHLADQHIRTWLSERSADLDRRSEAAHDMLPQVGLPVRFMRRFRSSDEDPFEVAVFCISASILLLQVTGTIKVTYARELIPLFQQANPCQGDRKPHVILDFSGVNHVAYQARKQVMLSIHVLRNKSSKIWMIGSDIMQTLTNMHQKMYPASSSQIEQTHSLVQAIQSAIDIRSRSQETSLMFPFDSSEQSSDRTSPAQLRALLNSAPDPIFSLDIEGKFLDTNDAGHAFFHRILDNTFIPGVSLESVWPFFSDDKWADVLFDLRQGKAWEGHIEHIDHSGQHHVFQTSFTPFQQGEKEMNGISLFLRDITKEKTAEREAKYQRELIDSISYSIQEGLFRSSPQKGIMFVNQAFVEMFGYESIDEVLKLDPYELYVDKGRRDDFVRIVREKHSFINEEVHFRRKDGSTFWGLISSLRKTDANGLVYHDGAIRDVTVLREAQTRLQEKNEELTKVNRELDAFVYRVSHDLRAPLVSLLGLISIMRLESSQDKQQRYLTLMEKSIEKLDHFINEIMNYSRNARISLHTEPIALRDFTTEAIESLRYSEKGTLNILNNIPGDLILHSDPQRLSPIVNNLISNAIRYRDPKKEEQRIILIAQAKERSIQIRIEDNGIGIEEEHLPHIFDMFYRASRHSEGSGIGLYIVQETISKLGGTIEVESTPGAGTGFNISLPQHPETLL